MAATKKKTKAKKASPAKERELVIQYLAHAIPFAGRKLTVGRNASCELPIDDPIASRKHATFSLEDGDAWVEDHGSRNGVLVGGKKIEQRAMLKVGDVITIGKTELRLAWSGDPIVHKKPSAKTASKMPVVGSILAGRFRLTRVASNGEESPPTGAVSPCVIYDCENTFLGGDGSIAVLPRAAVAARPWLKAWLLYEARALRRAAHPHVLDLYDMSETTEGVVYLATARVPELTLEAWLATKPSAAARKDAARQLNDVVKHLHQRGIFHGALAASTIRIEMADAPRVKLCSFWCARLADKERPPPDKGIVPADTASDLRALAEITRAM